MMDNMEFPPEKREIYVPACTICGGSVTVWHYTKTAWR